MRHFLTRRAPLLVVVLAVALAACSSGDSDTKKKTKPESGTATTAASTGPTVTLTQDPAECIRGTFRFTRMDYDGPVQTAYGPTTIVGGIAGRRIELKRDNTFHFTDDGSERVQFTLHQPAGQVSGTAVLKAQADGTFLPTADTSSFNITALSGSLTLTFQNGQNADIPLPPDGAGVKETFGLNGEATYTCERNTVTFRFPALTIALERV